MKRLYFILLIITSLLLLTSCAKAQGSTESNYSTSGWDKYVDSTQYYGLYIFRLLSSPGGWRNWQTEKIDSLLHALVVYTDSTQMYIQNDTLVFSNQMSGKSSFNSTDTSKTITLSGFDSLDVVIVTPEGYAGSSAEALYVYGKSGSFDVRRKSGGRTGLKFNYIYIKKR